MLYKLNFRIKFLLIIIGFVSGILSIQSCENNDQKDLAPPSVRVARAIAELKAELTAPENGWRLRYQPEPGNVSGVYFMVLKFEEDGTLIIKSDVPGGGGDFINDTLSYRIDSGQGLELIFETYTSFHFLFEQNQATFGAEFEFFYVRKNNDNLVFESKSDITGPVTQLIFEPASTQDLVALNPEIAENLQDYNISKPNINVGIGAPGSQQQLVLVDKNISVFWEVDLLQRFLKVNYAAVGVSIDDINTSTAKLSLNHETGYYILNGKVILLSPLSFSLNGENITISEITLNQFDSSGDPVCQSNPTNTPVYKGLIDQLGAVSLNKTLFSGTGLDFTPNPENPYNVNAFFVFGDSIGSLLNNGVINDNFTGATGFVFNYGLTSGADSTQPANAVGLFVEDEKEIRRTVLRKIEPTETIGNRVTLTFKDSVFVSNNAKPNDTTGIIAVTNEIFEGGTIYAYDEPVVPGIKIFRLYNPCNNYEFFLVKP